jgi:hypothetical protein
MDGLRKLLAEEVNRSGQIEAITEQVQSRLLEAEALLAPFGVRLAESPTALRGALAVLAERRERFAGAVQAVRDGQQELGAGEAEAKGCLDERSRLLVRTGLAEADLARVPELCALRPGYVSARDAATGARARFHEAERGLEGLGEFDRELLALSEPELDVRHQQTVDAAEEIDRERTRSGELGERVRVARTRSAVEDARAVLIAAGDALRDALSGNEAAVVGDALRGFVEDATRDRDRPAVFHRARELLSRFTRGRYELRMGQEGAEFRALDTVTKRNHPLDELSRGTRVQLLLATRLAFIEHVEEDRVRLPLFLDEALGNSDDERADAIIDAVVELARDGRQIFFLTARTDEASRWLDRVEGAGLEPRLLDLAAARSLGRFERTGPATRVRVGAVPAPGDLDHVAYGELLRVPAWAPHVCEAEGLHLWYLVEDPHLLHRLLSLGVSHWGGLRSMRAAVGPALLGEDEAVWPRIEAMGGAAEAVMETLSIGYGRPVTMEVLDSSGLISDQFRPRVLEVLSSSGGDAEEFMAGVRGLPRFRAAIADAVGEWLEERACLDVRPALGNDEVVERVVDRAAADVRAELCDVPGVLRMIGRLRGGAV